MSSPTRIHPLQQMYTVCVGIGLQAEHSIEYVQCLKFLGMSNLHKVMPDSLMAVDHYQHHWEIAMLT